MGDSTFTIDQITKFREIERARMKRGEPGLRTELQELIWCLQFCDVGPKSDDSRETQAKRLWDMWCGREQKMASFGEYLATIPEVPEELRAEDERFPRLILVDARLDIVTTCKCLGVDYEGDDQTFEDHDPKKARTEKVYWIRAQDGKKNRGKTVRICRKEFTPDELGLTVHEGLAIFAQHMELFRHWGMDLVGSVSRE